VIRAVAESAKAHDVEATGAFEASSLWELFHRESFDFWDTNNRIVAPVLVFDQFEEVFQVLDESHGALSRIKVLLDNISELVENRVPARLAAMDLPNSDEYRFDMSNADYRVILSFREDYLPHVRQLRAIVPSVIENHLRLEPLDGEQARQVVQGAGKALVDAKAAELLVRSVAHQAGLLQLLQSDNMRENAAGEPTLRGLVVEPAILSVVCFYLNTERQRRRQERIDVGLVKLKKPEDIFDEYYRWAIADAGPDVPRFVENALVTTDGQRVLYPIKALDGQSPVIKVGVDKLVARGVLRREWFGGEERLEVSHDLLLRPITEAQRDAQRECDRQRFWKRFAIAAVLGVLVLGGSGYVYDASQRAQAERNKREASLESALVATIPGQGKNDMARMLEAVHHARSSDERANALEAVLNFSVANAAGDAGTRTLPTFAATYAQLQMDRDSRGPDSYNSLLAKLRQIIAGACEKGFMLPLDQAVLWFEQNGGIPPQCK
jgi:Novel STAND NTPase 1